MQLFVLCRAKNQFKIISTCSVTVYRARNEGTARAVEGNYDALELILELSMGAFQPVELFYRSQVLRLGRHGSAQQAGDVKRGFAVGCAKRIAIVG